VDGAAANALDGALPDAVREERLQRFMQVQAEISQRRLQRKVGTVQRVLIDHLTPKGVLGRSMADAPEIDGLVHVTTRRKLAIGAFIDVRIDRADAHDLFGVPA
jgi:ribosomal protein S12 methylthiotransferase